MKTLILGYQKLLEEKAAKNEISNFLIEQGIAENKVDEFCEIYDKGFKSGINHVITNGLSSQEIKFGVDPVFDSAFNMGKHIFRKESSLFYKYRFLAFGILIFAIIIILAKSV